MAVAAGLQALIEEDIAAYEAGALADDLAAALEPLPTFELSPDQFGRLQKRQRPIIVFLRENASP